MNQNNFNKATDVLCDMIVNYTCFPIQRDGHFIFIVESDGSINGCWFYDDKITFKKELDLFGLLMEFSGEYICGSNTVVMFVTRPRN